MSSLLFILMFLATVSSFSPDTSSLDAYGLKLAANDILLVESSYSQSAFTLRLAPYNYSLSCTLAYNDSGQYIYAVAVQRYATTNDTTRFVFIGINQGTNVPFIGSLTYTGITGPNYVASSKPGRKVVFPCSGWQSENYRIHQLEQFADDQSNGDINNDFFVVTVAPTGHVAYGFTKNFLLIYNLDTNNVSIQSGNTTWRDPSFLPHAVDVSQNGMFVILGYVGDSSTQYTPCAYLLDITNSTFNVLDTWLYTAPSNTSWQAGLTNWDADVYSAKYDLSVNINSDGSQVLLGIQIMNTIVVLNVNGSTNQFNRVTQTLSNGKAIGMGKAVGWLDINIAVVLVNTYSFDYLWSSSQVFIYNVTIPNTFVTTNIIPNVQQTFSATFGPQLLSLVMTENGTMAMLDSAGDYYILLPSSIGAFSDSSTRSNSAPKPCMGGTFAPLPNLLPCSLCPPGTTTNGLTGQSLCVPCKNNSFCPLGAAFGNIDSSSPLLTNIDQVFAYPRSPQSVRFDNILIQNVMVIYSGSSRHCLLKAPLFWAVIVISFSIVVWLGLLLLKYYVKDPRGVKTRQYVKKVLKKSDLIGEGEMVIGGLFSFSILVLVVFAYTFSYHYFNRYPIAEITGNSTFACDPTLSNAQFNSGLMTTGIPPSDIEAPIFALLDAQLFTLYVEFVNTLFKCSDVTATQVKDTTISIAINSCSDGNSTLSISLLLPSHGTKIQILLADKNTIGGLHIRLEGPGVEQENPSFEASYKLLDLAFAQTLSIPGRLLTQQPSCALQLTKVINQTYPLSEHGETQYSAIWLPSFSANLDQIFVNEYQYTYATSPNTILSIDINETPYYVSNVQKPITDEAELIFTNILFTIVCLEIFGLGFLLFKLIIVPLVRRLLNYFLQRRRNEEELFDTKSQNSLQLTNSRF